MRPGKDRKDDLMLYWNCFLSGDDHAFSKIYQELVQNLFSFGTTFTTDSDLIKDCIQDVFIRLYQNKAQLASIDNIKAYILIALKNTLINTFNKQQTYRKFIDAYDAEDQMDDSEEDKIITRETDTAFQNITAKYKSALTIRQQEIIHYRFVEDLTIDEISKLLGINYQTVANTIQKSLKKIRNLYLKEGYKK